VAEIHLVRQDRATGLCEAVPAVRFAPQEPAEWLAAGADLQRLVAG
jgi:hypothetical protein